MKDKRQNIISHAKAPRRKEKMKLEKGEYAILSVQWGYPDLPSYPQPPLGKKVLWEVCIPWPSRNYEEMIPESIKTNKPYGYSVYLRFLNKYPPRKLKPEVKAKIRKKRLKNKLMKKYPLIQEVLFSKEIKERALYFDIVAIAEGKDYYFEDLK